MTDHILEYNQDQQMLPAKDVRDWVKEDSLEQFVSDTIDILNEEGRLDPFYPELRVDGRGRHRFHPVMLLKVLVFAYCNGIRSSRAIHRLRERAIAFLFLADNQQPNFRTICNFRTNNREAFTALFAEVLELCEKAGMVDLGEVALDGHRVHGDSAVDQSHPRPDRRRDRRDSRGSSRDRRLGGRGIPRRTVATNCPRNSTTRRIASSGYARPRRTYEQEQARKDEQIEKIHERAREERATGEKTRGRKPTPPDEVELDEDTNANVTDPESSLMKPHDVWIQGYNGQAMVDCDTQVIVAEDVTTDATDKQQLEPMLDRCEETTGERPEKTLADAGYWSRANAELGDEQTELFIATTKSWKRRTELREKDPPRGRIPTSYGPKERMERKLRTKRGRRIYAKRSSTVEPVFGQHVNRGCDRFMLRGKTGAQAEWSLFSLTHNLMKLWRGGWKPDRRPVVDVITR